MLAGPLLDEEFGGWYAAADGSGPLVHTKQAHGHAFVLRARQNQWRAFGHFDEAWKPLLQHHRDQRMHWVDAEAINTATALHRRTGDQRFLSRASQWWAYADRYLVDHERGSWHHELDESNACVEHGCTGERDTGALPGTLASRTAAIVRGLDKYPSTPRLLAPDKAVYHLLARLLGSEAMKPDYWRHETA